MQNADPLLKYRTQHQHRLNYMPWLYWTLKPKHKAWAMAWQQDYQNYLKDMEDIDIGEHCFISPLAHIFAEPNRKIVIGDHCFIAADSVLHGPITLGNHVAINHHCTLDGGRKGIRIGANSRLAAYCKLYAFNHGMDLDRPFFQQAVSSKGIDIGEDVWLGANVGVVDGVKIANHAVVGMHSLVSRNIEPYQIVAGNPIRVIGDRRQRS